MQKRHVLPRIIESTFSSVTDYDDVIYMHSPASTLKLLMQSCHWTLCSYLWMALNLTVVFFITKLGFSRWQ